MAELPQAEPAATPVVGGAAVVTGAAVAAPVAAPSTPPSPKPETVTAESVPLGLPVEPSSAEAVSHGGRPRKPSRECDSSPSSPPSSPKQGGGSPPSSPGAEGKAAAAREQVEIYFSSANTNAGPDPSPNPGPDLNPNPGPDANPNPGPGPGPRPGPRPRPSPEPTPNPNQVEFYFSEANLARDPYMRRQIESDLGGEGCATLPI